MRAYILSVLISGMLLISCESEQEINDRLALEEEQRIELEVKLAEETKAEEIRVEQERIEQEKQAEIKRLEQQLYEKYINNSLGTGATPYSKYYGGNASCNNYGCSEIKVRTSNSDVLVTIKKDDKVVEHAYINAGSSYSFSFPNGTYQAFFYYGKGWNPEKEMKNGEIKGGFISAEDFGKDSPQNLYDSELTYELIMQQNGNFSTRPSSAEEAL
jgi:hypothetical protein